MRRIIDCHIHPPFEAKCFVDIAELNGINYSKEGLIADWKRNNVVAGIAMGLSETKEYAFPDKEAENPMLPGSLDLPDNLFFCLGVNPYRQSEEDLLAFDKALRNVKTIGIKIYGGYYHEYIYSNLYKPFYELARNHKVPVAVHLSDVFGQGGGLKFAHPLTMDELAGLYPDLTFIICHLGDPWNIDAAEVIARNKNVYSDLSGLIPGDRQKVLEIKNDPYINTRWKQALAFLKHYGEGCGDNPLEKLMFGTDWPITELEPYIEFIEELIPDEYHDSVFFKTALEVFPKLKNLIEMH